MQKLCFICPEIRVSTSKEENQASSTLGGCRHKSSALQEVLSRLFDNMRVLGSTPANKDNTFLIDPFARRCILNDLYNGFHLKLFSWNSKINKPRLSYLLFVVQPFF